ncbi:uncharacterized protein FFB14_04749 [Fusarium fujikuroi]|nr:uncharacterized protein FFB14_04749 [Fusarium fujikuroi]
MHIESNSDANLQDLFCQLARYFSANEDKISAAEASKCFLCLSLLDSVALIRLFFLLCPSFRSVLSHQGGVSAVFPTTPSRPSDDNDTHRQPDPPEPPPGLRDHQNSHENNSSSIPGFEELQDPVSTNDNGLPTAHSSPAAENGGAQVSGEIDDIYTLESGFLEPNTFYQQQTLNELQHPISNTLTVNPFDTMAFPDNDNAIGKTRLATCSELSFTATLRQLLETCKTDKSLFIRKIEESKASLPNGQGWRAAIAIKQENADMRDLLSIYHRFECYNIYRHVAEAGFHTGEHWIRDKRLELAKRLCDDFPERFHDTKAANKCLNWVDQGCRYHEWTKMFTQVSGLGILIALPPEIPRSAYTSRCTKEHMSAAAARFVALGINDLVKDLKLSELGDYIARRLEEMTTGKRLEPSQRLQQSSTPRLVSSLGTPTLLQSEQTESSPGAITICEDTAMLDHASFLSPSMFVDDDLSNFQLSSSAYLDLSMDDQLPAFSFPFDELYQHLNNTEVQMVTCSETTG